MTPRIETDRLILRGRTVSDFPAYAAMWAAPEVARYTTVNPLAEEDAWVKFARMEGLWALTGYGFWIVEEKTSGAVIGEIGVADFRRNITPTLEGKPEFGWVLAPGAHGKGYAREALVAALEWGEAKFPNTVFSCIIDAENAASIRLAEAFGFKRIATAPYKGAEIVIFHRRPRE
ncbi:MAG: GNAT family N-acetyltransferase [Parvularculaceae bacterium]|nr:GNAT family N-acetyltransferase [Parvularculaceae bacterium]